MQPPFLCHMLRSSRFAFDGLRLAGRCWRHCVYDYLGATKGWDSSGCPLNDCNGLVSGSGICSWAMALCWERIFRQRPMAGGVGQARSQRILSDSDRRVWSDGRTSVAVGITQTAQTISVTLRTMRNQPQPLARVNSLGAGICQRLP